MDFMDLVPSDANIQSRLFDMSPSSFIRAKFSDVKFILDYLICLHPHLSGQSFLM